MYLLSRDGAIRRLQWAMGGRGGAADGTAAAALVVSVK